MINILYISYDGLTDSLGRSQILPYLQGLSGKGYGFTIVSLEKPGEFKKDNEGLKSLLDEFNIGWIPVKYDIGKGFSIKRKNNKNLSDAVKAFLQKNKVDLIHSRSYPASLIALKLKKIYNIPFIFDMRGFWADERVDGNIWDLKKPLHKLLYRYFKKKEKLLLEKSAHVISLTQAAKDYMVKNFGEQVQENKITVIPCCADLEHFNILPLTDREQTRKKLDVAPNQELLIYSGSVGTWYMLHEMMAFFNCYRNTNSNAVFLVLTQKDHDLVHKTFSQHGIKPENYRVTGATRQEVPAYINAADAGLYFIKPAFSKMASSPVKLAEFMGCGLPVVANAGIGDVDNHAAGNNQLILIHELNDTGYKKAIEELAKLKKDKNIARNFAINNYSLEIGVERYKKVYMNILTA